MTLLVISLLTLVAGPLLFRVADRARPALAAIDGFVMVSVAGLAIVHIIPHAAELAGPWAVGLAIVGFFGPGMVEHRLERAANQAHAATLALAILGLSLHEFLDGVGLATGADGASILAIAVVLHRLPIAITIWSLLAPFGTRLATVVLVALGAATLLGYLSGDLVVEVLEARWVGLFEALIAGSLLHVVVHRPAPIATPDGSRFERWMSGVGALLGIAVVALLADRHLDHHVHDGELGFGKIFVTLALESAPALMVAFVLAGVVHAILPAASLRWMGRGSKASQAARGIAFGVPLSVCSCGVIPLYRTLVLQGVPATAAMSFLIATPELGIDAVLISLPLLGAEFTAVRLGAAAVVALITGVVVGRLAEARRGGALSSQPIERRGPGPTASAPGCASASSRSSTTRSPGSSSASRSPRWPIRCSTPSGSACCRGALTSSCSRSSHAALRVRLGRHAASSRS